MILPIPSPRLACILAQLPPIHTPRALNVGCGAYSSVHTLRQHHPTWALYGLDRDARALRIAHRHDPALRLIQADARTLPGLLRATFGLILVRHPDLFRHQLDWYAILHDLPALLAADGVLLLTVYGLDEVDLLHTFRLPARLRLDESQFASANHAGQDRYAFAWSARSFPPHNT